MPDDRKCTHGLDPRSCALCEPATTEAMEQEIAELRAKLAAAERAAEHSSYWYGCRFERLREWAHASLNEEQRHAYFSIVANGTASTHEPPTYAQRMNALEYERDAAIRERDEARALLQSCARVTHGLDVTDAEREQALSVMSPLVADLANARLLLDQKRRCECSDDEACAFVRERDAALARTGEESQRRVRAEQVMQDKDKAFAKECDRLIAELDAEMTKHSLTIGERDKLAAEIERQKGLRRREEQRTLAALADLDEVTVALRLLWEEVTDESRCTAEAGHCLSLPCKDAVRTALKGDK